MCLVTLYIFWKKWNKKGPVRGRAAVGACTLIDISCISDWDLSLHSLSSDRPCFFLFWYKMNTHGMSIVAGYFMTVFQAKTWYRITFNLKPHEFKIFRSWTYFMLPFVSEEYKAHFMAIMMMMIWWLIREQAYDNNIRKILKCFQKQRLWWEHRKILEKLEISELFSRI